MVNKSKTIKCSWTKYLVESDLEVVKNAIIYDYSNRITEGFNNKNKV